MQATTPLLRLLLADDHELFREGLVQLLGHYPDLHVVGQASNGFEALELSRELMPDVVLMDIDMPQLNGLAATRAIAAEMPYIKVVILTVHEDEEKLFEAIKSGAQGYLLKNVRTAEMLEMLRGMAAGEAPISRLMASRLLKEFARQQQLTFEAGGSPPGTATPASHPHQLEGLAQAGKWVKPSYGALNRTAPPPLSLTTEPEGLQELTLREREVLELVARRSTNKEIAARLNISEFTVKNHLRNILAKLHLRNRSQAAQMLNRANPPAS